MAWLPRSNFLREMEWHVHICTVENSNFLEFPAWDVQAIATLLTLSPYSEVYGCDPCTPRPSLQIN
jgi:hypothetical protein